MSTVTEKNEAAERLRASLTYGTQLDDLYEALAAERDAAIREHAAEDEVAIAAAFQAGERHGSRATVERIRAAVGLDPDKTHDKIMFLDDLDAILDEEAQAEPSRKAAQE